MPKHNDKPGFTKSQLSTEKLKVGRGDNIS